MSVLKHIDYVLESATLGSNIRGGQFTGNSAAIDAEWTVLTVTTPGILTDGTRIRAAWKIGDDGSILDTYGNTAQTLDASAYAYDPGQRAMNILRVSGVGTNGETILIGSDTYELDTDPLNSVTTGNKRVDVSGGSTVRAVGTLTFAGQPANNDTVTIDARVYTWKTTLTGAANEVLIGGDVATSITNLQAAVNALAGAGTLYGTGTTIHLTVQCSAVTATTFVARAISGGVAGNSIDSLEAGANTSWGAATLATGVSPTQAEVTTAIVLAINTLGDEDVSASEFASGEIILYSDTPQALALACTDTMTNGAWANATMVGGIAPANRRISSCTRVPTATEVTLGNMHFKFNFTVRHANPVVRVTATGVVKAWAGALLISGDRVTLDNLGATDWAATDTIYLTVTD